MPTPHQPAQPETAPATAHMIARKLAAIASKGRAYLPSIRDGANASGWEANGAVAANLLLDCDQDYAFAKQVLASPDHHAALISERDRLRDALEKIKYDAKEESRYSQTNPHSSGAEGHAFDRIASTAETALIETTPSESARLREINAELVRSLGELVSHPDAAAYLATLDMGIGTNTPDARWLRARAALKKAKDAQGGISA